MSVENLFCKPVKLTCGGEVIYKKHLVTFHSLNLDEDLGMIYSWVNHPSTKRFWNLDEPIHAIRELYESVLNDPGKHSFVGSYKDKPICQVDLYRVLCDELKDHIPDADKDDCGLHFLMSPVTRPVHNLTLLMFQSFLDFYFSFPMARRMFGEPDALNEKSIRMIRKCGFKHLSDINLSYKIASLHLLTKEDFYAADKVI